MPAILKTTQIQEPSSATANISLDSSGNVGIGTDEPVSKLHTYGSSSARITVQSNGSSGIDVLRSDSTGNPPTNYFIKTRGTVASPTAVASSDQIGIQYWRAYGGTNYRNLAYIAGVVDTYTSDSNISSYLSFATSPAGSASPQEHVRIDDIGNVYIMDSTLWQYAPAHTSKSAAATLTAAEIKTGIIVGTGTSYTLTMPTGTNIDAAFAGVPQTNIGFDFYVISGASGTITIAVNTGVTNSGGLTIGAGQSAHFRLRRTAANTYVMYRLA